MGLLPGLRMPPKAPIGLMSLMSPSAPMPPSGVMPPRPPLAAWLAPGSAADSARMWAAEPVAARRLPEPTLVLGVPAECSVRTVVLRWRGVMVMTALAAAALPRAVPRPMELAAVASRLRARLVFGLEGAGLLKTYLAIRGFDRVSGKGAALTVAPREQQQHTDHTYIGVTACTLPFWIWYLTIRRPPRPLWAACCTFMPGEAAPRCRTTPWAPRRPGVTATPASLPEPEGVEVVEDEPAVLGAALPKSRRWAKPGRWELGVEPGKVRRRVRAPKGGMGIAGDEGSTGSRSPAVASCSCWDMGEALRVGTGKG